MSVTLEDFQVRYRKIREEYPEVKNCTVSGCDNPRDVILEFGESSLCAYHRLLFDCWTYEVLESSDIEYYAVKQQARRTAFTKWRNNLGKEKCDKIVLKLAQEPVNWAC